MSSTLKSITARLQSTSITAAEGEDSRRVTLVNKDSKVKTPLNLTFLVDDANGNKLYYGEFKSPRGFIANKVVVLDGEDNVVAVGSAINGKAALIKIAQAAAEKAVYWGDPWYLNTRKFLTLA